MKRTNLLLGSLLFVFLFSASAGFSQTAAEYKTKIQALTSEMAKCMVDGNIEKGLAMYAEDAISMPSYQPMQEGISAIRAATAAMVSSGMKYNTLS